jgi:uncharacterized integral membrane protein
MVLRILGLVVAVGASALLVARNSEPINVDLVYTILHDVPAWMVILGSLLLGALATGLACSWPIVRYRLRLRKSRQRIAELEQELHGLRTLPLGVEETAGEAQASEG